ncbi:hypothetical protein MNBD_GAMMA11-3064 [hydrothermal vent metagenome]|uniref:8-oxo-dGTP diphosphatase n=1 Tax=hydrothermal vent metagenome TaxID=652676 RepID=A0A3B0X0S1_9ZZZZ
MPDLIHVALAIIVNQQNEVLVSLRPENVHQGGLWEFPGGKVETEETVLDALKREISEELDIDIKKARPFKVIQYEYPDKSVSLNVWMVMSFVGKPRGGEGQQIKWQAIHQLNINEFPQANRSIIHSLILPEKYMITGSFENESNFLLRLENSLKKNHSESAMPLVQLRCKALAEAAFLMIANQAQIICKKYNAKLLLNATPDIFRQTKADGLHLNSQQLYSLNARPIDNASLLSVSCHTQADIKQAEQLGADIILLSPVKETTSHPGVKGIGWERFSALVSSTHAPVYALGGMGIDDIDDAKYAGAQGVAAISSFWKAE